MAREVEIMILSRQNSPLRAGRGAEQGGHSGLGDDLDVFLAMIIWGPPEMSVLIASIGLVPSVFQRRVPLPTAVAQDGFSYVSLDNVTARRVCDARRKRPPMLAVMWFMICRTKEAERRYNANQA